MGKVATLECYFGDRILVYHLAHNGDVAAARRVALKMGWRLGKRVGVLAYLKLHNRICPLMRACSDCDSWASHSFRTCAKQPKCFDILHGATPIPTRIVRCLKCPVKQPSRLREVLSSSISPCRVAAPTARSPGGCLTVYWKSHGLKSTAFPGRQRAP